TRRALLAGRCGLGTDGRLARAYSPHPRCGDLMPSSKNQYSRSAEHSPPGSKRRSRQPVSVTSAPAFSIVVQNSTAARSPSTNGFPIRTLTFACVDVPSAQYERTPSRPRLGSRKGLVLYSESSVKRDAAASASRSSQARRYASAHSATFMTAAILLEGPHQAANRS